MPENCPSSDERMLALGIGVLLAVEMIFVSVLVIVLTGSVLLALSMVVLTNVILFATLALLTWLLWLPWQRRYPAQPIDDDAVTRTWQSFVFGYVGAFNHCLSITADARHLHVHPFLVFRWFGAQQISLPWDRMRHPKPSMFGTISVRIDQRRIAGPSWAMKLAQQTD